MSTKIQPIFLRNKTAFAVGFALCTFTGATLAQYTPRPVTGGVADTATTDGQNPVTIDVLANDGNVDANSLVIGTQPTQGTVAIQNGAIVYTPNADYSGTDTFTYQVMEKEWRKDANGEFVVEQYPALTGIDSTAPIATSYTAGTAEIPIIDGDAPGQGAWNTAPVTGTDLTGNGNPDPGVIGKSYQPSSTTSPIEGCYADDASATPLTLTLVWNAERSTAEGIGGNQFTITSDAAPSPAADGGGVVLQVHSTAADVTKDGSSYTNATAKLIDPWAFEATAIWANLSAAEFETLPVTILASLYNGKMWMNNSVTFNASVDYSQCSEPKLKTGSVTITEGDSGNNGGGSSSGGGGGGGAIGWLAALMLSAFGLSRVRRRQKL
ncbi:MAG: cadherin-like domain-containing protein [Gammaproteobacteria bacterium]|nr:cadherin-like domain-containing protein [Gammaproteobacteria bacterium]